MLRGGRAGKTITANFLVSTAELAARKQHKCRVTGCHYGDSLSGLKHLEKVIRIVEHLKGFRYAGAYRRRRCHRLNRSEASIAISDLRFALRQSLTLALRAAAARRFPPAPLTGYIGFACNSIRQMEIDARFFHV